MDYQDGSFATTTYNADSTVATSQTRDGLTLTYAYDAANRPLSVVPPGTPTATLAPLDSGNAKGSLGTAVRFGYIGGGVNADERRIAYRALREAGLSPGEARSAVEEADKYFYGLGHTPATPQEFQAIGGGKYYV